MALSAPERSNLHKLVVAMFNAAPGAVYLAEITLFFESADRSLSRLADALGQNNVFNNLYPAGQTNAQFANALLGIYNLQGHTEAQNFVATLQAAGISKPQIALRVGIAIDASNSTDPALIAAKAILNNKAVTASNYGNTPEGTAIDLPTLQGVLRNVTADPASINPVAVKPEPVPEPVPVPVVDIPVAPPAPPAVVVNTITLNMGGVFNGTAGLTDNFFSTLAALAGTTLTGNGGDTDTLTLTTAGTVTINNGSTGGTISNIKVLTLANGTNSLTYNTPAGFTSINGGTGDDTFTPSTTVLPIFVNGGSGTDTLVLTAAYGATASGSGTFAASVTGFEKLRLTGAVNQTIDLQTLGNYSDVTFSGSNGLTLNNLPNNGKVTLMGAGTALSIANAAFAGGLNDTINLTLTDGSAAAVAFATTGITASGVETANISVTDSQTTPTGAFNNTVTWLGNSVKTINVNGNAGLTLSATSTALTTVDASGTTLGGFTWMAGALTDLASVKGSATGINTVNLNSATAGVSYIGGTGNDNLTINATVSSTAALGSGSNGLSLSGDTILGTYTAGNTGTDSLAFFSATPNLSNATITGFENLTVTNNANITATAAQLSQFSRTVNAAGVETVNLTTAGTVIAFINIEKYNLANGTNTFTASSNTLEVTGGTGSDTFNYSAVQVAGATFLKGGSGSDTLNIGALGADLNISALVSEIETINLTGSAATGYTFTNADGPGMRLNFAKGAAADSIVLGSGGQTTNLLGTAGTPVTIYGGSGQDTINLSATATGSETIGAGSNKTSVDTIANFNLAGTDYFKTGVNALSVGSYIIGSADTANYLTMIANGLSIFFNNTGQAYRITIQAGTAAGTYVFQNTGADTSQFDNTDFFVRLTGTAPNISAGSFIA